MTPDTLSDSPSTSPFLQPKPKKYRWAPQGLGTGTSSLNDYRPFSFGEARPEVRISGRRRAESSTSSRSTMASPVPPAKPPAVLSSDGHRQSVASTRSAATANMERKRSSIASLSRLVTFSRFGERSKLFIESRPVSPAHDGRGQVTQGPAAPIEQADSVLEGSRGEAEEE